MSEKNSFQRYIYIIQLQNYYDYDNTLYNSLVNNVISITFS